jgi:hypothetical protein
VKLQLPVAESLASLGAAAIAWLAFSKQSRWMLTWVAINPALFFVWVCARSDWSIPEWYRYGVGTSLLICACGAAALASRIPRIGMLATGATAMFAVAVTGYVVLRTPKYLSPRDDPDDAYSHARQLAKQFGKTPGRFAMGNLAGTFAFVTELPILQLEGLAADETLVKHIAARDELIPVLREYHVDYVIFSVSSRLPSDGACVAVSVPDDLGGHAGPHAPRMSGRICSPPVFSLETKDRFTYVFRVG